MAKNRDLDRVLDKIESVAHEVRDLHHTIKAGCGPSLNPRIAAVYGRRLAIPVNVPVPQLLDTEKILLSVMPRKADGHVDTNASVTWTASGDVGAEPGVDPFPFHDPQFDEDVTCPGSFNCYALTPNASGTGTVVASATGYESAEFGPITYAPGVPRSLNASTGSPISDL